MLKIIFFPIIWKLIFPSFVFSHWKKSDYIFIGSDVWYAKSPHLFPDVSHLLHYERSLSQNTALMSKVCKRYLHLRNNFIKYQISYFSPKTHFLSCSRITAYPNNAIYNTCPKGVMFTNHVFECPIQPKFDYSRFSEKGDQDFESRFFKLSFHILIIWNDKLFCFYIIK